MPGAGRAYPRRQDVLRHAGILLIGGDKTGDDRLYEEYVPVAGRLYDDHVEQLRKEKLIK
jgi:hypothetical protein